PIGPLEPVDAVMPLALRSLEVGVLEVLDEVDPIALRGDRQAVAAAGAGFPLAPHESPRLENQGPHAAALLGTAALGADGEEGAGGGWRGRGWGGGRGLTGERKELAATRYPSGCQAMVWPRSPLASG